MAVALMLAIFPVIATADDTKSQQQQEQTTDVSAPLVAEIETLKAAAQEVDGKNAENTARFIQAARVVRSDAELQQVEKRLIIILQPEGKLRSLYAEVHEVMERMQAAQYYGNDEIVREVAFLNCTPMGVEISTTEAKAFVELVEPFFHSYLHTIDLAEKTDGTNPTITKEFCKSARETGDHFTYLLTVFALKEYGDERICMEETVEATIEEKMLPLGNSLEKEVKRVANILDRMKDHDCYGNDDIKQADRIIANINQVLCLRPESEEATPEQIKEIETKIAERAADVRSVRELNVQGGPGFTKETAWVMKDTTPDAVHNEYRVIYAFGLPDPIRQALVHGEKDGKTYDVHTIVIPYDEGDVTHRLYFDITEYWKKQYGSE